MEGAGGERRILAPGDLTGQISEALRQREERELHTTVSYHNERFVGRSQRRGRRQHGLVALRGAGLRGNYQGNMEETGSNTPVFHHNERFVGRGQRGGGSQRGLVPLRGAGLRGNYQGNMEETGSNTPVFHHNERFVGRGQRGGGSQRGLVPLRGAGLRGNYQGNMEETGSNTPVFHHNERFVGRSQRRSGLVPLRGAGLRGHDYGDDTGSNTPGCHEDARFSGRRGSHHYQHSDQGKTQLPGYTEINELAQKDPSEVILVVANTRKGYYDLLKGALHPNVMILVVKVLAKVCQVDFKENKTTVLATVCNAGFLETLASYISTIPTDTDPTRKDGIPSFLEDLFMFCGTVMDLLPNTACEHLGPTLVVIKGAMASASTFQSITFAPALTERQAELEAQLMKLMSEREKKPAKEETSPSKTLKHQPLPNNFRELSIFPLPGDILTQEKAFVRPNIVEGAYDSIEHYLDVQFRLLREDFVWPLREGITDYMQQVADSQDTTNKDNTNNIRIHRNVKFLRSTVEWDKVGFVTCFDTQTTRHVNWEHSKRFIYGSLLCFTEDNFASVMFGTVLDRKVEDLRWGQVTVELIHAHERSNLFHSEFVMVESEVYFEPYYHVLRALQSTSCEDFPMARYIVRVRPETEPPRYLAQAPAYKYDVGGFQVAVLDEGAWPTAEDLALDDSQYRALKLALTKEFVVIQGPPGTGKTYLGLKIAATIITNIKQIVDTPREPSGGDGPRPVHSPLLVVCFTNHALDQFLEGLLPVTENIVRIGGQSKSDVLAPYNLREKRNANRRHGDAQRLSRNVHERMSRLMSDVKGIQQAVERLDTNYGVVSIASVHEVYRHDSILCFAGDDGKLSDELFLDWLVSEEDIYDEQQEDAFPWDDLPPAEEEVAVPQGREEGRGDDCERGPEDDFDLEEVPVNMKLRFFLRLKSSKLAAEERQAAVMQLEKMGDHQSLMRVWMLEMHERRCKYIAHKLNNKPKLSPEAAHQLLQPKEYLWTLSGEQRWALYHLWVGRLRSALLEELRLVEVRYRAEVSRYQETRDMEDLQLIRGADVIGMTTTGAARRQPLLRALRCRVVIVEEAAEVMESHIVVSLTSHCQHLILIGDHRQLRPTTAVYRLARDFHLDISLFERMLRNGLHCEVLRVQHRMRPEIARLIVPSIYSELRNHESVLRFQPVRGVARSLFFLTHSSPEQEIGESHSRRNTFEADMLLRLCRYLLLQGYPSERITILATYSGQMFYLHNQRAKSPSLKDVQMTIVDNFQGEENDIILLSLVRNNDKNNVGFLKTENRVCVALSRAKHGMYIMGNIENLTRSGSSVWPLIKETLEEQSAVGNCLTLCCPVHKDQLTQVRVVEDFDKVPEGGCSLPCATTLACGHVCVRVCHATDREHVNYDCREPCTRAPPGCALGHPCPQRCGVQCRECVTTVERRLPCDHSKRLPCRVDHITYQCLEKISYTDPDCGHTFEKLCHIDFESARCPFHCDMVLECGHSCVRKCHARSDPHHEKYKCLKPCPKNNEGCTGEHACPRKCFEPCELCCVRVEKKAPACQHVCTVDCSCDPADIQCSLRCERTLPCGHPCQMQCCQPCGGCNVMVSYTDPDCGHTFEKLCPTEVEKLTCPFRCDIRLECGHTCVKQCHARNDPNHEEYKCLKPCPKNNEGCTGDHACPRKCFEPCEPCCVRVKKKAPACQHVCTVDCSCDPADIQCSLRCERTLPCGHPCQMQCCQPCGGCNVMVRKTVEEAGCGHTVTVECGELPQRRHCTGPCRALMACGHRCRRPCSAARCSDPDTCEEPVPAAVKPACGHDVQVPCRLARTEVARDDPKLLGQCRHPCHAELQCGHRCEGTCGLCLQGRIHHGCLANCGRVLICGHTCSVPCAQACPPCRKKCRMRCVHSRCNKNCGQPCTKCQEPCEWRCPHKRCTRRCWQLCNREPCHEPCPKLLRCKHPCIGFCGEPCPRLCRVCDRDRVETVFFGHEDEPGARFVYLSDCKHVVEARGLETWLSQRRDEVAMPRCPLCNTDIMTSMRYMNSVKRGLQDVQEIKRRIFGEAAAIERGRAQLIATLMDIKPRPVPAVNRPAHSWLSLGNRHLRPADAAPVQPSGPARELTPLGEDLYRKLYQQLNVEKYINNLRCSNLSSVDLQSVAIKLEIFKVVQRTHAEARAHATAESLRAVVGRADLILGVLLARDRLSPQEVADVNLELRRLRRAAQFCRLQAAPEEGGLECLLTARDIVFAVERYSDAQDAAFLEAATGITAAVAELRRERRDIVAAMGLARGHWFKCPQGHYYAIGECGGAMEVARCPECGAAIGGTQHALLADNRLASEIDGATRSAWPGAAMNL